MPRQKKKWPTVADLMALDQEQAALVKRKAAMRAMMGERFAALAETSGLMELDIPDATLEAELRQIAGRFRMAKPVQSVGPDVPKADGTRSKEKANGARSAKVGDASEDHARGPGGEGGAR